MRMDVDHVGAIITGGTIIGDAVGARIVETEVPIVEAEVLIVEVAREVAADADSKPYKRPLYQNGGRAKQ